MNVNCGENKNMPFSKSDFFLKTVASPLLFQIETSFSWPSTVFITPSLSLAEGKYVPLLLMKKFYR